MVNGNSNGNGNGKYNGASEEGENKFWSKVVEVIVFDLLVVRNEINEIDDGVPLTGMQCWWHEVLCRSDKAVNYTRHQCEKWMLSLHGVNDGYKETHTSKTQEAVLFYA